MPSTIRTRFFPYPALLVLLFLVGPFLSIPALAQLSSAAVNGTVRDQTGASVPKAIVTLRSTATSVERSTLTNDDGNYAFPSVSPGTYILRISSPSFQTEQINAFTVAVDQVVALNSTLKPGDVKIAVEVEAQGVQIESSTSQLGTVMEQKKVQDLPLNGRNFTQLLTLTPGATPVSVGQNSNGGNTAVTAGSTFSFPSINGQPNRSNLYLVDGMNDNNAWYNTYAVAPVVDSIQEFKVNSHNDAQYGQVTGGVVNVATKSGTNQYHGTLFEYIRNNAFDAQPRFTALSAYHLNQFGGVLGGPLSIPKLYDGRNKTFLFLSYEGTRYSKGNGTYFLQPTAAQLGESTWGGPQDLGVADFSTATTGISGCADKTATSTASCQLYDPTVANTASSRPAFTGNQIPVSKMDARAVATIHKIFSAPVTVPGFAPTQYNGVITTPTRQTSDNYSGRIDQHIGDKDFIFFRYSGFQLNTTAPGAIPHLKALTDLPAQQYGVSWLHIFGPRTSMQVQYGRTHVEYNTTTLFDISNSDLLGTYGVDPSFSTYVGGVSLFPTLGLTGYFSGGESSTPSKNLSSIHEWKGQVIHTLGRHQVSWGGGWDQANFEQYQRNGSITFNGASTGNFTGNPGSTISSGQSAQSGNALASYLLNYPSNFNFRNVLITERPGGIASAFVQDSFRMTSTLTVNIGVRYDRGVTPQYGTDATIGQQGSIETGDFDFATGKYIIQVAPPLCSIRGHAPCLPSASLPANVVISPNRKIMRGTKTNIGPRFGIAYSANSKLALRAGFGINYDNWSTIIQLPQNFQGSWPDVGTRALDNTNAAGTNYTSAQNPFGSSSGSVPAATPFDASNVNYFVDPNIKNPYSEQWNLGLEQQLGNYTVFSLNYVGSQGHRTDIGGYTNIGQPGPGASFAARRAAGTAGQPFPYTVPNRWDSSNGNSNYNGLQASLLRQFRNGFGYTVAYTWSKAMDSGQSGWFGVEGNSLQNRYDLRGSRSVAAYDIPHILAVGINGDLPFGKGKRFYTGNRAADFILGGWQVNVIFTARSGQPYTITAAGDIANVGNGSTYERANLVGNPTLDSPSASKWFNTAAFATPTQGTYGNSSRNMLRTQRLWNLDTSVFRVFPIYKEMNLNLRAESFNVANHPTLSTPGTTITTPSTFGIVTSVVGNQRLMQFAAKINF
ncbi:MAG: carboxypeptidase-like regulatory domain-containing protein [Edaphobacter sp.]|uniref:TonB-dependent receptor n=1 Tax=Edaphobacter sp. TaxID=1934404 RepID=UPI0023A2B843|nr:carboxypeptidase-like regulatory domain-containing protein [Edaphobacter sp.]MDE1176953.1 carboxypeptidase-like regulatory domain-containing protein [Edaphobacter sp.]